MTYFERILMAVLFVFFTVPANAIMLERNAATTILVGPFVHYQDGVAPVTDVALTDADTACIYYNASGTQTCIDLSGKDADWTHRASGWYELDLTATNLNYAYGRHVLLVSDQDEFVPVWHEFMVVSQNIMEALGEDGTTYIKTNPIQIEGTDATTVLRNEPWQADHDDFESGGTYYSDQNFGFNLQLIFDILAGDMEIVTGTTHEMQYFDYYDGKGTPVLDFYLYDDAEVRDSDTIFERARDLLP